MRVYVTGLLVGGLVIVLLMATVHLAWRVREQKYKDVITWYEAELVRCEALVRGE